MSMLAQTAEVKRGFYPRFPWACSTIWRGVPQMLPASYGLDFSTRQDRSMRINASFSGSHGPAGENALPLTKEDIVALASDSYCGIEALYRNISSRCLLKSASKSEG